MFYCFGAIINIASFFTPLNFLLSSSPSSPALLIPAHSLDFLCYSLNVALLVNLVFCVEGPSDARINLPKHDVYVNTHRNSAAVSLRAACCLLQVFFRGNFCFWKTVRPVNMMDKMLAFATSRNINYI
jgi:hypothetical protein